MSNQSALVLSAGGARGAYQVGVIKAIAEVLGVKDGRSPFDIFCGVSAGSLNAAGLAAHADNFSKAISEMERIWETLSPDKVFRTDLKSIGGIGVQWMRDLSLGGFMGGGTAKALLDTAPLRDLMKDNIPLHRIRGLVKSGALKALTVTATNYYTSNAVTFVQAQEGTPMWKRRRRVGEACEINVDHLMASSAIPFFFPSIELDGRHFGDGCVRNMSPISPAVQLGANKIVAIGVRQEGEISEQMHGPRAAPSIAHISGVLLDAVLLDSIELDMVRLMRINDILSSMNMEELVGDQTKYRPLDAVWISPSEDIGEIASTYYRKLPKVVRYLLKGLGPDAQTTDIVSFLLFDPTFCSRLIELGYHDGMKAKDNVLKLFNS